jgi:hypothetical protein
MGEGDDPHPAAAAADTALAGRRRWRRRFGLAALALLAGVLTALWMVRADLADRLIAGEFRSLGIPATYHIDAIGPRRQVLSNVVVGDPARPDFTVEQMTVWISPRFGVPAISRVELVRPRLYGSWHQARLSLGSLDKLFEQSSTQKFSLPKLDLAVRDGRARLDTDYGPVGIKVDGSGGLRGGFNGVVAAIAPELSLAGCAVRRASLFGTVSVKVGRPGFAGPLRLGGLDCPARALSVQGSAVQLAATFDSDLAGFDASAGLASGPMSLGAQKLAALDGTSRLTWRGGTLTSSYRMVGHQAQSAALTAGSLTAEGSLRLRGSAARLDLDGSLAGQGLRAGEGLDASLRRAEQAAAGSLAAPLLAQLRAALARQLPGGTLAARFVLHRDKAMTSLVVPSAALRSAAGIDLLSLTRGQYAQPASGSPLLSGNFASAGPGLPRATGNVEQQPGGNVLVRLAMDDYRSGDARLAVPQLALVFAPDGAIGIGGAVRLSGPLPGGRAENLALPLDGSWTTARGLSLWRRCTAIAFDRLAYASLALERRQLTLCPGGEHAILRYDARGLRIAAGAPSLDLVGHLGESPIHVISGPVGVAIPGALVARRLDVALGPANAPARFQLADLTARIGKDVAGHFSGTEARLAAVPLDLVDASGDWRYADGRLTLAGGAFRLKDRQAVARFQPLVARGAALTLADNRIAATAVLREPASDREVADVAVAHDLASGTGHADLKVHGVLFDDKVQPMTLSNLALGVIADTHGTVRGTGRIDWTPDKVTSSGDFATDALDFAAAFGPVKGAHGTVHFTDLLGMVTAPDQQLMIAAINPGIEVDDGTVTFALKPDNVLQVEGAKWPFMGGTLELKPVRMVLGASEVRRYELVVTGLDAQLFVQRMELANLDASGTFDGTLPLIFDENGGRIEGGVLIARPPGGNVSYVGELTYKDLGTMANFAFQSLRSLDYRQMRIAVDGPLGGEIITRVRFDGVTQGKGAKSNFLTRQVARLPIRFNVNIRAAFYQLITNFKSFYDPAYVKDPREVGLIGPDGKPIRRDGSAPAPPAVNPPDIQTPVSRKSP